MRNVLTFESSRIGNVYVQQNKMTASNLGIVIGPNVLREPKDSFFSNAGPIFEKLIIHFDSVFPKEQAKFTKAQPKPSRLLRVRAQNNANSGTARGRGLMGARDAANDGDNLTSSEDLDSSNSSNSSSSSNNNNNNNSSSNNNNSNKALGDSAAAAAAAAEAVFKFGKAETPNRNQSHFLGERRTPEPGTPPMPIVFDTGSTVYAPPSRIPAPPPRKRPGASSPAPPVAPLPPVNSSSGTSPPAVVARNASSPATASARAIPGITATASAGNLANVGSLASAAAAAANATAPLRKASLGEGAGRGNRAGGVAPAMARGRGGADLRGRGRGIPPSAAGRGGVVPAAVATVGPPPPIATVGPQQPTATHADDGEATPPVPPRDHICAGCEGALAPNSGIKVLGQSYHVHCFTCHDCGHAFGKFIEHQGKAYCPADFSSRFGDSLCVACQQPLSLHQDGFITIQEQHWHTTCFACTACSTPLESTYFLNDEYRPLCANCQ
jgi:RNase P subunit RPR2